MKFKTAKRFISIALVICMLLSLCFVTNATGTTANELELATAEKIEQMVERFYSDVPGDYEIGNAIPIYNADVTRASFIIPIFCNQECIGRVEVDIEGNVVLIDDVSLYNSINELPTTEYLIYNTGGLLFAEFSCGVVELYDSGYNVSVNEDFTLIPYAEKVDIVENYLEMVATDFDISSVVEEVELTDVIITGITPRSDILPVTTRKCSITNFVTQGNYNLCWAACVATIVNYKKGLSLSAANVAVAMGHTNYTSPNYAGANALFVIDTLSYYGLTYSISNGKLGWSLVKSNINNNRPFIAALTNSNNTKGHQLVGYGYECNSTDTDQYSSQRYLYIWNPRGTKMFVEYNGFNSITLNGNLLEWKGTLVD